jgi:uncharacterized protein YndB with AHSA1/START domain
MIANIALDDGLILPHSANPIGSNFRERQGEFVEVIPPKRLVFTWGWKEPGHPVPAGSTRVEIDLEARDGGTLVRLTHHGVPEGMRERHEMGWTHYLHRLKVVVAGGDPGKDPYSDPQFRHR